MEKRPLPATVIVLTAVPLLLLTASALAQQTVLVDGGNVLPALSADYPSDAPGYPSRSPGLDALPGFKNPPPGYGQVPFWWWSADDLDVDRLLWQLRELHQKNISGVQVNYSHYDTPGWMTASKEPEIFSKDWWKVYSRVSQECKKLGMGIGLSTYTLDWPNGAHNLFYDLFYSKRELNAISLITGQRQRLSGGETKTIACIENQFAARAYPVKDGVLQRGGTDLTPLTRDGKITWTAPRGEWEIWTFATAREAGSMNPLMLGAGETIINGYFQKFQDHNPGKTSKGLNFFFNDELEIGLGKFAWNPDFPQEFRKRKGYDLMDVLPAMWGDMGDITPKVRIDYADVRMSLMEERYFKPIHDWHASRGIIFGCDNHGRGLDPHAYGDYFRACRWYTAPGHDTPGGRADPIKGKVSSSIANLYRRPRVWLEGYHSLGWGATPEHLMFATRENYLYGCTLLNLHGLYYSTYGSRWEWAPPCYHFRMPYWKHMGVFLKYFERLSYLMSQGHTVADVAILYPVTPYEAEMNGEDAKNTAFGLARQLITAGISFEFIDHQSLAQAKVTNGRLVLQDAGASYQALVVPNMKAVRWKTIEEAAAFAKSGGCVLAVGELPLATDRTGRNDAQLTKLNRQAFGTGTPLKNNAEAVQKIRDAFVQDVGGLDRTVRSLHRKIGFRDVYLIMDAQPGDVVEFRAKGAVELWDPWTGDCRPLPVVRETATGTQVQLPLEKYEAQVVVFTGERKHQNPAQEINEATVVKTLSDRDWNVAFIPTMDNRYGDFRVPVTPANKIIGIEARRFRWTRETDGLAKTAMRPETDDSTWKTQLHGYGPQFWQLEPIPVGANTAALAKLEDRLAKMTHLDPSVAVEFEGQSFRWMPYEFSWRYGVERNPGHQGFHGNKGKVTDNFLHVGSSSAKRWGVNKIEPFDPKKPNRKFHSFFWTRAVVEENTSAFMHVSEAARSNAGYSSPLVGPVIAPAASYINGKMRTDLKKPVELRAGFAPVLLRFDDYGEAHFVLRKQGVPIPEKQPLAMRWYNDAGVIPFAPNAAELAAQWFRFLSAPGTTAIWLQADSREPLRAWIDGMPMIDKGDGRFAASRAVEKPAVIAIRLIPPAGRSGGAVIPKPVAIETNGRGSMMLGDWSRMGVLNNYSGGVTYSKTITLTADEAKRITVLDLGKVVATAEVQINGTDAGVRVAPPWQLEVSGLFKPGNNTVDVSVYSTLANHYQTIPSYYRGDPVSGLMGPVRLLCP